MIFFIKSNFSQILKVFVTDTVKSYEHLALFEM